VRARIVLLGEPEEGAPVIFAELDGVETESGEKLEIAGLAGASTLVAAHHLGRAPTGVPLFIYTATPTGG
jgi:hypothetical protein